ncbi:membrane hypothetical protein [Gammaproteobacteria bacterium]
MFPPKSNKKKLIKSKDDIQKRIDDDNEKLKNAKSRRKWKIALVTLAGIIIVAASVGILLLYFIGGPIGAAVGSVLSWIGTGLIYLEKGLSFLFSFAAPSGVASTIGSIISNVLIGITVLLGAASIGAYIRSIISNVEVKSLESDLKEAEEIKKETEEINKALEKSEDKVFAEGPEGVININFGDIGLGSIDSHAIGIVIENIASPESSPLNLNLKGCNVTDKAAEQLVKIIADPNQKFNLKNIDLTGNTEIRNSTIEQLSKALEQNVTITKLSFDANFQKDVQEDIQKNIIKQIIINNYLQQNNEQILTFDNLITGLTPEQQTIAAAVFSDKPNSQLDNVKNAAKTKIESLKLLPPSSLSVCKEQQKLFETVLKQNELFIQLKKFLENPRASGVKNPMDALYPTIEKHPERFCTFVTDNNNSIDADKIRQLISDSSNILELLKLEPTKLKAISKLLCGTDQPDLAIELFNNMAAKAVENIDQYQDKANKDIFTDLLKTALNDPSELEEKLSKLEKKNNPKTIGMVKSFIEVYKATIVERPLPKMEEDIKKLIGTEKNKELNNLEGLDRVNKLKEFLQAQKNSDLEELRKAKRKRIINAVIFFGVLGIATAGIAVALVVFIPIIQGIWKAISNIVAAVTTGAFLAADAGSAVGFWDKLSKFFEGLSLKNIIGGIYRKIMVSEQITQLSDNVKKNEILVKELNGVEKKITKSAISSTADMYIKLGLTEEILPNSQKPKPLPPLSQQVISEEKMEKDKTIESTLPPTHKM